MLAAVILRLLSLSIAAHGAFAADCAVTDKFSLEIRPVTGRVREDYSMTAADIGRAAGPVRAARHYPLLGMVDYLFLSVLSVTADVVEGDDGLSCAIPRRISIRIGYEPVIIVAKEAAADECLRTQVVAHEMKHIAADNANLRHFARTTVKLLRLSIMHLQVRPSITPDLARRDLYGAVRTRFDDLLPSLAYDAEQAQKAVDTPQELRRLRRACDGKGTRLVERSE